METGFKVFSVGQRASIQKRITEIDMEYFSLVSLDRNPIHFDDEFAKSTVFGGRIVHGMLSASLFSGLLGNVLPGPGCIYLSQTLKFKGPVRRNDLVTATVVIIELIPDRSQVVLSCVARVGETIVIEGEARMKIPSSHSS